MHPRAPQRYRDSLTQTNLWRIVLLSAGQLGQIFTRLQKVVVEREEADHNVSSDSETETCGINIVRNLSVNDTDCCETSMDLIKVNSLSLSVITFVH